MQNKGMPTIVEIAIVLYCVIMAVDLPHSWLSTPSVRYAWVAFLIWIAPWIWSIARNMIVGTEKGLSPALLGWAVVTSLAGSLASLHVLNHFGLAMALAGMLPYSWQQLFWLVSSISWMPALGYATKAFTPSEQWLLQVSIAVFGSFCLFTKKENA